MDFAIIKMKGIRQKERIMKKLCLISLLFLSAFPYSVYGFQKQQNPIQPEIPELEMILQNCSEYCEKLAGVVLHIVCTEKTNEIVYQRETGIIIPKKKDIGFDKNLRSRKSKVSEYVYDYQLIRKNREIKEQRILIKENGKERREREAALKTRFHHEFMILGPTALLSKEKQGYFDYRITGKKKL